MPAWAVALVPAGAVVAAIGLVWLGFRLAFWHAAREAVKGVDVEYALLTDEFGSDGLWFS